MKSSGPPCDLASRPISPYLEIARSVEALDGKRRRRKDAIDRAHLNSRKLMIGK